MNAGYLARTIPNAEFINLRGVSCAPSGNWWAGRDNAVLMEPASSQETCLKTRRLPRQLLHAVLAGALAGHLYW